MGELKAYPKCRNAFERGDMTWRNLFDGSNLLTFESNIAYPLRFMIDHHVSPLVDRMYDWRADAVTPHQIVGMNWLELPAGTYKVRSEHEKISNAQLEIECEYVLSIS